MAIFKKSKHDSDLEFDTTSTYSEPAQQPSTSFNSHPAAASVSKPARSQNYGIEDAIELMRKLPNVNSEITITVVRKTLESANIQVEQIISDAERKETQIETRTDELSKEIAELQDRISHLNEEITELTADLKETTKVKNLLVGASEAEKQAQKSGGEGAKKIRDDAAPQPHANAQANANAQPKEQSAFVEKA
jgi:uncharacterized small protein (DUF1192 family)